MHSESPFPLHVDLDWLRDKLGVVVRVALRRQLYMNRLEKNISGPSICLYALSPEYSPYTVLAHRGAFPGHHTAGQLQPCGYQHERLEIGDFQFIMMKCSCHRKRQAPSSPIGLMLSLIHI